MTCRGRSSAVLTFAVVFAWSLSGGRWAIAAIVGLFGTATLASLGIGIYAWRRGMLGGHS